MNRQAKLIKAKATAQATAQTTAKPAATSTWSASQAVALKRAQGATAQQTARAKFDSLFKK